MNLFIIDNTQLRRDFFTFIKFENRPTTLEDCESQLMEMLNRHRADINRSQFAHQITKLIAAQNVDRAVKLFNAGIKVRAPRTWFVFAYHFRYILAFIAIVAVAFLLT